MTTIASTYDALIVGAGPNGLAAAITIARTGRRVLVIEARETIGGGCRSSDTLTLPGFTHDLCSAIHPMALASPFLRTLPLERYGVAWMQPPLALAHPFDHGTAAVLDRSLEVTAESLGEDADAYRRLISPLVENWEVIIDTFLGPLRPKLLAHPLKVARFGLAASRSARGLARATFKGSVARGLLAGLCAHAQLPLEMLPSAAAGLMLGVLAHAVGWPIPRGGSQTLANALAAYLRDLGGEIVTGVEVKTLDMLPSARVILCDVTPRQLLRIAGARLAGWYKSQLRHYRYGMGVFKLDLALDGPIPWTAEACRRAGTVHLGGTLTEIAASERAIWRGRDPERPYVLLAQQSLFDQTRAPEGKQTVWAYCHVPNGSTVDMTERIEAQIERFAPGFRDRILARHSMNTLEVERYNANYIGGDINGGVQDLFQLFTRPTFRLTPYATSDQRLYICSSSTPPGGGVHGLCGYFAAQAALRYLVSR